MIIKNILQTTLLSVPGINYAIILPSTYNHTLLWLHGYKERSEQLLMHPIFEQLAEQYQTAIIFPDVPDTYYMNQPWNDSYTEDFLIQEFIPYVVKQHDLPSERNSLSIAGISMGGFGSLLLGVHYPEVFGKIACISGAFIIDDLAIGNPEIIGSTANIYHFQSMFGDILSLADDPSRNPWTAIKTIEDKNILSPIYLACGTEDLLYRRNIRLYRRLQERNLDVSWYTSPGNHDWKFFHQAILHTFEWLYH